MVEADLVVPVPNFWWKHFVRGTNSPTLLAHVFSRHLRIPVESRCLRRRRNTLPQSSLRPTGRVRNLQGALNVTTGYALQGAKVLLVDDLMTTGSTCNEATRRLKEAGAGQVTVAVLARAHLQ